LTSTPLPFPIRGSLSHWAMLDVCDGSHSLFVIKIPDRSVRRDEDRKSKSPPCRRKRDKGGAPSGVGMGERVGQPPHGGQGRGSVRLLGGTRLRELYGQVANVEQRGHEVYGTSDDVGYWPRFFGRDSKSRCLTRSQPSPAIRGTACACAYQWIARLACPRGRRRNSLECLRRQTFR
jgi:hypothetical protein